MKKLGLAGLAFGAVLSPAIAGTVTGRVGYTVTPTMLLYVKGGGGWMHDIFTITTFNGNVAAIGSPARPAAGPSAAVSNG